MKAYIRFIILTVLCFALLFLIEDNKEKPLDWNEYYTEDSKKPLGCYALSKMLPSFNGKREVTTCNKPFIESYWLQDYDTGYCLMMVNSQLPADEFESAELLAFVSYGNTLFLAARSLPQSFMDSLGIRTNFEGFYIPKITGNDSLKAYRMVNPSLPSKPYYFQNSLYSSLLEFDSTRTKVLSVDEKDMPVYVSIRVGAGRVLLHLSPEVFSNYYLMDTATAPYAYSCLSYLPQSPVLWDEYYKSFKKYAQTPLRYVLSSPPLKWAYFILLAGVVLFVIYTGKRRQRAIPVVPPLRNTTLDFIGTVGRLYHQHGDHSGLARKKISHFFDHLRTQLYIDTSTEGPELAGMVADKSGYSHNTILEIFRYINLVKTGYRLTTDELSHLHRLLEDFYNRKKT